MVLDDAGKIELLELLFGDSAVMCDALRFQGTKIRCNDPQRHQIRTSENFELVAPSQDGL